MGKVKSFFRGLSCPKSSSGKGEYPKIQRPATYNPTDVRNNKKINRSTTSDEDDFVSVMRGDNFSFSTPVNTEDITEENLEPEITEFNQGIETGSSIVNFRDNALVALCNTLSLKIRHVLLLSLVCMHQNTTKAHLYRHFVKKVVIVLARNLDKKARQAVVTLRQNGVPLIKPPIINGAVTILAVSLAKNLRWNLLSVFFELRSVKSTCTVADSKNKPKDSTNDANDPSVRGQPVNQVKPTTGGDGGCSSSSGKEPVTRKLGLKKSTGEIIDKSKVKIGDNIFKNAIKNVKVKSPVTVEHKANIVWELDFFTCEPYLKYVNKSMECSQMTHHDISE
ncbi:uncharacterized protein BXIN_1251 [Babesia sp. Xinjiang]|uniref:uncharacterized protein n=1 Tax=Babesia sp. Xinjiang TaxID=462227 RepID=UPI000A238194|nr:uncharacterized protein BXIN_1251 [Babesia sp. Xinjiang]ORM39977.1 hypothetical protein BXIN_1251 [Babesia sp. Xinjiang]